MTDEQFIEFTGYTPTGSPFTEKIRGTIQEALNTLSSLNIRARQIISYTDDGTNAEVIYCKIK